MNHIHTILRRLDGLKHNPNRNFKRRVRKLITIINNCHWSVVSDGNRDAYRYEAQNLLNR